MHKVIIIDDVILMNTTNVVVIEAAEKHVGSKFSLMKPTITLVKQIDC